MRLALERIMSAKTQLKTDTSTDPQAEPEVYESALKPLLWIMGIPVVLVVLVKIFL